MWVDLCTCIKWFWDVIFTQRIFPVLFVECVALPRIFQVVIFCEIWILLDRLGKYHWRLQRSQRRFFFTLYFIQHSIDTVQVQNSWFFLRTHWQERLHQPQQPRVLSVLVPSAKKTSAAKSQDYEFVLIIQWSSVKHLALEIWYPMVWISH